MTSFVCIQSGLEQASADDAAQFMVEKSGYSAFSGSNNKNDTGQIVIKVSTDSTKFLAFLDFQTYQIEHNTQLNQGGVGFLDEKWELARGHCCRIAWNFWPFSTQLTCSAF
jgi:hypothetical protein